jgi:hypothetical protein
MHAKARAYSETDPEVSLMLARKAAEAICKAVYCDRVNPEAGNLMLDRLMEQLSGGRHIPKRVLTHLRTIQLHGNFGSHDQEEENEAIDSKYILPCVSSLDYASQWFLDEYLAPLEIRLPITVSELAEELGIKGFQIIRELMDQFNIFANINYSIEGDVVSELVSGRGFRCKIMAEVSDGSR